LAKKNGMLACLDEQIATMDTKEKLDVLMDEPFRLVEVGQENMALRPKASSSASSA
jgi:endoglucanase